MVCGASTSLSGITEQAKRPIASNAQEASDSASGMVMVDTRVLGMVHLSATDKAQTKLLNEHSIPVFEMETIWSKSLCSPTLFTFWATVIFLGVGFLLRLPFWSGSVGGQHGLGLGALLPLLSLSLCLRLVPVDLPLLAEFIKQRVPSLAWLALIAQPSSRLGNTKVFDRSIMWLNADPPAPTAAFGHSPNLDQVT